MTIQQATQKAIEGGWKGVDATIVEGQVYTFGKRIVEPEALLDPLFWQSLGKAMGWGTGCNICSGDECINPKEHLTKNHKYPWQIEWHRFIDHLAEGKSIELFFAELK